jgi:hypothetical protein
LTAALEDQLPDPFLDVVHVSLSIGTGYHRADLLGAVLIENVKEKGWNE